MNDHVERYCHKLDNVSTKAPQPEGERSWLQRCLVSTEKTAYLWQHLSKREKLVIGIFNTKEGFYRDLTVEENLKLFENLSVDPLIPRGELISLFELDEVARHPCKRISKPCAESLGMALSLVPRPDVVIWDLADIEDRGILHRVSEWFSQNRIFLLHS